MSGVKNLKQKQKQVLHKMIEILEQKNVDWAAFDHLLASLPDMNETDGNDTALSELYHECPNGEILVEITKRFLKRGYDVKANSGRNGAVCLHNLCWATYDRYIVDAAKLLLLAGADPRLPLDKNTEDEDGGVRSSIGWRLSGDWAQGYYTCANIFEAYWKIIEAYEAGKDYQMIDTFESCIGETLNRVEIICADEVSTIVSCPPLSGYFGHLVLHFGSKPLIVSNDTVLVVNPVLVEENKSNIIRADEHFSELLGAKLVAIEFADQCAVQLQFDNGMYLLLSGDYVYGKELRYGYFEIRKNVNSAALSGQKIDKIALVTGRDYFESCRDYSEKSVALICGERAFLLYAYPEGYDPDVEIRLLECSVEFVDGYRRWLDLPTQKIEQMFFRQEKLSDVCINCGDKNLYISVDAYDRLRLKLTDQKLSYSEALQNKQTSEQLVFRFR